MLDCQRQLCQRYRCRFDVHYGSGKLCRWTAFQAKAAYINGTVSGSALFASQLVYNNNTLLEAQFWARETDVDSVYGLTWTLDDSSPNGEFPVVVKASEDS
ncbi:uncharacterized protein N7484_008053 [Penicillium longicatenatum]|uniref:uncharacterized protein n=1 Tax=Penicillium longicatenatum TaxID=1561947 RepID=UPI002549384C|nr:uncharacterized protein N7484_008053 [Penicillium longicatenatum]KAJ5640191.1 hypothetical protein N7484_008053 [Penicillium longicatenatum]